VRFKEKRAIIFEEHQEIIAAEAIWTLKSHSLAETVGAVAVGFSAVLGSTNKT